MSGHKNIQIKLDQYKHDLNKHNIVIITKYNKRARELLSCSFIMYKFQ